MSFLAFLSKILAGPYDVKEVRSSHHNARLVDIDFGSFRVSVTYSKIEYHYKYKFWYSPDVIFRYVLLTGKPNGDTPVSIACALVDPIYVALEPIRRPRPISDKELVNIGSTFCDIMAARYKAYPAT